MQRFRHMSTEFKIIQLTSQSRILMEDSRHFFQERTDQKPRKKPLPGEHLLIADVFLGPNGVRYREVLLYT